METSASFEPDRIKRQVRGRISMLEDKPMAGGGNWISGAIKHPGALHRELGVPMGQKIPAARLDAAAHSSNKTLARRARLAETLKRMQRGK